MDERARGLTVVLTAVTLIALGVSFASGNKARRRDRERATLQAQVQKLTQETQALQAGLQDLQEKYTQETATTQGLKEALVQEQLKNQALTEELQRQQQKKASQGAGAAPHAKGSTTNFTTARRSQ